MKIAVATEQGKIISDHFGRSPYFAMFEAGDPHDHDSATQENQGGLL